MADDKQLDFIRQGVATWNAWRAKNGADLSAAVLREADVRGAHLFETVFGNTNLKRVRGLDSCSYDGPSVIDHRTLVQSGRFHSSSYEVAACLTPLIEFLPSLLKEPIQFYSCFISYSSKDRSFATKLHAQLQAHGVRCWKDSEDLKIGDRFQEEIESAILGYDKLLVILSGNSVSSMWVEREVQAAFEKERQHGSTVLFPVRLDDAVMDCPRAWAAEIRRTRNIGDFRNWKARGLFELRFNACFAICIARRKEKATERQRRHQLRN